MSVFLVCTYAGILWNLSSKESLKERLASETLSTLSEKILVPLAAKQKEKADVEKDEQSSSESHSETEIFCNTTGCLRCSSLFPVWFPWLQHAYDGVTLPGLSIPAVFSPMTVFAFYEFAPVFIRRLTGGFTTSSTLSCCLQFQVTLYYSVDMHPAHIKPNCAAMPVGTLQPMLWCQSEFE